MYKLLTLVCLMLSAGCGTTARYNPQNLEAAELATVKRNLIYPCNYWLIMVNGKELPQAWTIPVAPGSYPVGWMKTCFGSYADAGFMNASFEKGKVYKVGPKDPENERDISIWEVDSGNVVSW